MKCRELIEILEELAPVLLPVTGITRAFWPAGVTKR